eukprot:Plantae.Rhodophyta-Hildenbrandia_rubra.ctg5102.p1 GENE.Plantae.Rhodophyta-Hildenbrandia_rubra.ctg5102~~Plantae.Rhodophyta-Hildenbrandia_rubra.ctg5102.p1  ORF type:complete len:454 (-),score=52.26 Plantae.Rhodophyta-Hildenbrandia_rubra.ctg5102:764-2125(-)
MREDLASILYSAESLASIMGSKERENDSLNGRRDTASSPSTTSASLADLFARVTARDAGNTNGRQGNHKFWDTQPVARYDEPTMNEEQLGVAIENKTVEQIRKDPYPLISQFDWCDIDLQDPREMDEVFKLLTENYVEDTEASFRFSYSRDFLRWALLPPGWRKSWHVGVRVKAKKKLVGFITAIPATISVWDKAMRMVEINFLCIHKKLRSKRLAPVLIKEITRRVNLTGVFQAIYTAGIVLPAPVSSSKYWHRSLQPKKLIEVGFSRLTPRMTMKSTIKLYSLKPETQTPGVREMEPRDIPKAYELLTTYLKKFKLRIEFTQEEFSHWLHPRDKVIYTYVVEDPNSGEITDMFSFYSLPSNIIRHPKHNSLSAAYMFYHVPVKTPSADLMRDALILARNNNFDVFNALDLAENHTFFHDLRFLVGDGSLNYYLYNWKCPSIDGRSNAVVLV